MSRERSTGRTVAVKKLFPLAYQQDRKMFLREITVALQLRLPGVVPLLGFKLPSLGDSESGGAFLVSELMPNGCLDDAIDR
jgi:serine/threonine protein kinase